MDFTDFVFYLYTQILWINAVCQVSFCLHLSVFFHLLKPNLLTQEQNSVRYNSFYKNSGWQPRFANGFFFDFLLLI